MVGQGHRTVVVADDDPALRMLCRVNLEYEGYRVLEADSADALAALLGAEDISLVLLDVHLGRADGVELARALRTAEPGLRIALFSGDTKDLSSSSRDVADGFITKPFRLEDLSETVRRLARA